MKVQVRRTARRWSALRPLSASLAMCTALCLLIARPAVADPSGAVGVPNPGALPVPSTPLTAPATGGAAAPSTPVVGPLAQQILAKFATQEALGQKLQQAEIDLTSATQASASAYRAWQDEVAVAARLRAKADDAAAQAYKEATQLGPFGRYTHELNQLGMLAPGLGDPATGGPVTGQSAALDAQKAERQSSLDEQAYQAAVAHQQQLQALESSLRSQFDQATAELTALRAQNQQQLDEAEAAQEAADRQLAATFAAGTEVNGMVAAPQAIAAVRYALSKIGSPYVWGAEGPDTFDCSGLVLWSYQQAGVHTLPRVANDQYHATRPVPVTQLLPGDLLFFSTTSKTDWTSISHVAIYIGDGRMVEAPRTGETVKTTTVWWSAFFGATRVVPAVKAPTGSPGTPPGTGGGRTTPPGTTSPSASPTPASPSPSPSGSPTPTPNPTPSSPSPTVTPSTSTSASASASPRSSQSAAAPPDPAPDGGSPSAGS